LNYPFFVSYLKVVVGIYKLMYDIKYVLDYSIGVSIGIMATKIRRNHI